MNSHQLEEVISYPYLGVEINSDLNGTSRSTKWSRNHLSLLVCLDAIYLLVPDQQKS